MGNELRILAHGSQKKLADEIRYVYTFETNSLFLEFNLAQDDSNGKNDSYSISDCNKEIISS